VVLAVIRAVPPLLMWTQLLAAGNPPDQLDVIFQLAGVAGLAIQVESARTTSMLVPVLTPIAQRKYLSALARRSFLVKRDAIQAILLEARCDDAPSPAK
jgi:hypothetical protein